MKYEGFLGSDLHLLLHCLHPARPRSVDAIININTFILSLWQHRAFIPTVYLIKLAEAVLSELVGHYATAVQNRGIMWWLLDYWYPAPWWSVHYSAVQCTPVAAVHTEHWQTIPRPSTTAWSTLIVLTSSPLYSLLLVLTKDSQKVH